MKIVTCSKCKRNNASVNTKALFCCECFSETVEQNFRKEMRIGIIEKLKKLNKDHIKVKPPKSSFYVALGFGFSSQALLKLLSIIPNSGKRPDYQIKSFVNVDTSCLVGNDPTEYHNKVRTLINEHFMSSHETNFESPKLQIIPFCSSFKDENNQNNEILRYKLIEIIKKHLSIGTDYIKLLIQFIVIRDIKHFLHSDPSKIKCLILASASDSIVSESFQYMSLSSGMHARYLFQNLDNRWRGNNSSLVLIRPLRNISKKEIILYWRYKVSNYVSCNIGTQISICKSRIEDEMDRFIFSQNKKVPNISNIFVKLNDTYVAQIEESNSNTSINNCLLCGIGLSTNHSIIHCVICTKLTNSMLNTQNHKYLTK